MSNVRRSRELFGNDKSREKGSGNQVCHCMAPAANAPNGTEGAFQNSMTRSQESPPTPSYVRMDRVESIRAAIAQGCYHVPAADLAQNLIDHMLVNRPSRP